MPFFILCLLLTATVSWPAVAEDFASLEARLRQHPSLGALDHVALAQTERAEAASALPDPVISAGINNFPLFDPSFDTFLPTNKAVGVRQAIPGRASRSARARVEQQRAGLTREQREHLFAYLRGELIVTLVERRRIERMRILARERDAMYRQLEDIVSGEIDAGRPAVFRLAEIDIERAEVARTLVQLDGEQIRNDAQLTNLVGNGAAVPPPEQVPLSWNGEAVELLAARVATQAVAVADAGIDGAQAAYKPDWGVSLTYQQRESGNNFAGDDWVSVMVSFSVPLWGRQSQAPKLRAAQAERAAASDRHAASVREAAARWQSLEGERITADRSITVLGNKIAAIEERVASTLVNYEAGRGDYSPVIDGGIARIALEEQIALETARRDSAIARMNSLLVTP